MDSRKLHDWMQVIGIFAVVASLVFVGLQIQQDQDIAIVDSMSLRFERQNLRWRITDAKTKEPITDLTELQAVVRFDGEELGSFTARGSRREPGLYQTFHIFSKPGDGEVTLSFKREGSSKVHTVTFSFSVNSRKDYEIPR